MKLLLVKTESLKTSYDNKKVEIKKYLDNLDFKTVKNKEINIMKRVALLLMNQEEIGYVTIDYNNGVIEYKADIENLIATKILNKEDILVKVMSNQEEFIHDYNAIESNIESQLFPSGFISWEEKTNITKEDWNNIDFLSERIEVSSFEDVYNELITKKDKVYLSEEFIETFIKNTSLMIRNAYFSKLSKEELKSETLIKTLEKYNSNFFFSFFEVATNKNNKDDKELIEIIKTRLINENNIDDIISSLNIKNLIPYIPNKLRNSDNVISKIIRDMNSFEFNNEKISINEVIKLIGKSYFKNKKNFIYFMSSISGVSIRNDEYTDNFFKEMIESFDLKEKADKGLFTQFCEGIRSYERYKVGGFIVEKIVKNNMDYLTDKEKIMLNKQSVIVLNKNELLTMMEDESNMLLLMKSNSKRVEELILQKAKNMEFVKKLVNKENIVEFLKIGFPKNWLKSEKVPSIWKDENTLIIKTYGIDGYRNVPIEKRKEIEESKENILKLIVMNINNFKLINNDKKFDLDILKKISEECWDFETILGDIPKNKWYNFNFCLKLLEYNKHTLERIPKVLFNNKQFVLNVFAMYDNSDVIDIDYSMKELLSEIPEELKSFLQKNNINSNYINLLSKHFEKDNLELILNEKNQKVKKTKI